MSTRFLPFLLLTAFALGSRAAEVTTADICVYGGTSGGVAAAVQAARMGKKVVLIEPGRHLGGMTAGGLSAVDIGDPRSVGGIAREYFTKLAGSYGKTLAWDRDFEGKGGPATGGAYSIEPHVAERLFNEMMQAAKVPVHFGARLARVTKDGARITEFVTEDGMVLRAKMFIDATYEGDLMARTGVSYTLQREGNAQYGETYNGIHYAPIFKPRTDHKKPGPNGRTPGGQGVWDRDLPLDPYVVKGDPKSGLLPLLNEGEPGTPGEPAPGVQAYCFRLCLTTAPDRIPIAPPPDYDPKRYELLARFIEGCLAIGDDLDLRWFSKHDPLPNDKWDFNTSTFGGNLPGASWEWPEATYARREQIAKEHENYHRGLLHFLATDPRVPAKVRDEMKRFGLPRDEFTDHGGWPHQLYIREARRMISDLVLTEHHTFGREIAPNPISLGSYGTDTHEIRRIVKDGVVAREGKTAGGRGGFGPYNIGYSAIVPKAGECENLFVTFALSASHTAFSSVRMEPVFMATSQSAATAACLAIDDKVPVQKVDYAKLRARLVADGQVVESKKSAQAAAELEPKTVATAAAAATKKAGDAEAADAVERAHRELWRRLVDEHNVVLDYADLDGRIIRPAPEDCRELKPSALSWGVPVEDGPMFNGLYLDALCNRWKITRVEEDRKKARRLVDGLLFLASRGSTPGFIARGVATDGRTTYPMGSNDQTGPWLYGMWRYLHDGLAEGEERAALVAKFVEIVQVLDAHQWRMPCDGPPSPYRGSFAHHSWEAAPRLLFVLKAMHALTGDAKWQQRYLEAANERGGNNQRTRLDFCRTGLVFDPGQGARHSWTGSAGVVCLRALWEMETDPTLRDAYAQGLRASAELSAKSLPLCANFDPNGNEYFEHNWRVMNEAWKPQGSEAEAVAVANAGLRVQSRASPRLHLEKDWVREPCFAAWVVTLCPDAAFVAQHREAILKVITHYRYDRLYLSQFFPVESAWWRLATAPVADPPRAPTVAPVRAALPAEATQLIQDAGNAEDDRERQVVLEKLAALPSLDSARRAEAQALAEFVRSWNEGGLKFYSGQYRGKPVKEIGNYDFKVAADSPLHPLTAIYRGRILAWNLIENSTVRSSPELGPWFHREATKSFRVAAETFPRNRIPGMYLGQPIPWPKGYPEVAGAPEWAVLQREQLDRLRDIILWWIEHRQKSDGQFGGGWGDDCEMWRWWSSVLLGFDDPKITAAQLKFSKAAVERPHLKGGFNTEITDVEHAAEDTTDNLVPLMVLEPNEARWQDWALKLGDFMRDVWTGRNERGQLQFKSFYFSATGVSPAPARAFDVIADVGALHPALLAWQRTGDAKLGAILTAWLDTWVDATARAENGKPAGILPASIRWPDGSVAGGSPERHQPPLVPGAAASGEAKWWEPIKPGGFMHSYYVWPSVITEMTDALVVAYLATKDEKYLAPIRSMAAIRLRHLKSPPTESPEPGSEAWCAAQLAPRQNANSNTGGLVKTVARLKALTGTGEFDELLALEGSEFVIRTDAAGRRELEAALRESAEALRVNFPGFTSEVRSTDRVMRFVQFLARDYAFDEYRGVMQPKHELLYRMVTGDKNAPRFPQMAVRWLTSPQDIAALVTVASTARFEAELFHFGGKPRGVTAELRQLTPGRYHVTLLADGRPVGEKLAPLTVERGRFALLNFELPPRQLCVLKIESAAP